MARNSTWANPDGLRIGYGTHPSDNAGFFEVARAGDYLVIQGYVVAATLVDTYAATSYPMRGGEATIPRGSIAMRGSAQAVVACTTSSAATYDIGTWSRGLATEAVDVADGLVADITTAELTPIGETHQLDGTMIVAAASSTAISVGATSNSDCVIAPSWEETVPTAGTILITVEFLTPFGAAGRTISV